MKRFYARVEVFEHEDGDFAVQLDGKPIRTPAGTALRVPTRKLAERISVEWAAQRDLIEPASMPVTGLSNAAIDRIGPSRATVISGLATYIDSEPLRYRADGPEDLVAKEREFWDPVLNDFKERFGVTLTLATGLTPLEAQPAAGLCIRNYAESRDDFRLTALADAAQHLGSMLVAVAMIEGALDAEQAFEAAYLEELHQAEHWGLDKEAENRRRAIREDVRIAKLFDELARDR